MSGLPFNGFVVPSGGGSSSGGVSGLDTADGGTALADNVVVRGDGTMGIQGSGVSISDADVVSGATQLNVDNLRLDGNTLSSTNTDGDINLVTAAGPTFAGDINLDARTSGANAGTINVKGVFWTDTGGRFNSNGTAPGTTNSNNPSISLITTSGAPVLGIANGGQVKFSTSNNAENVLDQGISYGGSSNSIRITDGSTGIGNLYTKQPVEANTATSGAPNVLVATESNKILTNEGATAENYHTLPAATVGQVYEFVCMDTDGIRIVANGTDIIVVIGSATGSGGYISTTHQYDNVVLKCPSAGVWVASSINGRWDIGGGATFDNRGLVV